MICEFSIAISNWLTGCFEALADKYRCHKNQGVVVALCSYRRFEIKQRNVETSLIGEV